MSYCLTALGSLCFRAREKESIKSMAFRSCHVKFKEFKAEFTGPPNSLCSILGTARAKAMVITKNQHSFRKFCFAARSPQSCGRTKLPFPAYHRSRGLTLCHGGFFQRLLKVESSPCQLSPEREKCRLWLAAYGAAKALGMFVPCSQRRTW
jgi:hypothetical protein